ncbi:hypothetical protein CEXT_427961 [Caerostris extrusa]|uniref:Uncharacterized protein n=1 Tax=Caerostris extrusa TaxID=172846 RepID=A0AAV4Y4N7_CAEEX|nr:hypothetical protein CEXT_427961 [Caerostris extrusa]
MTLIKKKAHVRYFFPMKYILEDAKWRKLISSKCEFHTNGQDGIENLSVMAPVTNDFLRRELKEYGSTKMLSYQ